MPTAPDRLIVCYVTDRKSLSVVHPSEDLVDRVRLAVDAGANWVQVREKDLPAPALLDVARQALGAAKGRGARIVINDRLDVALAAGAHGVHLGHESISAREAVSWCRNGNAPDDFSIGVSCHGLEEARQAEQNGASYIFFGPIFETPSKAAFGKPQGIRNLAEVCSGANIPVLAIGGVTEKNSVDCIRAGAAGIAAIRFFQDARTADELKDAVTRLRSGS